MFEGLLVLPLHVKQKTQLVKGLCLLLLAVRFVLPSNGNYFLQVHDSLADIFWVGHISLGKLLMPNDPVLKIFPLLLFSLIRFVFCVLAQLQELLSVFNRLIEVA